MNLLQDLFSLLGGCLALFAALDRRGLYVAGGVGLLLAIGFWVSCSYYSRLWNLRYRVTLMHHFLCGVAAILTFGFTLVYASLRYTKEAAYASVQIWEAQINLDRGWAGDTFSAAYEKVKALGIEDFTNVPPPGAPNSHIPTNSNPSILAAASTYASSAARHFSDQRPFLSKIIHGRADVPSQILDADVKNYFATVSKTYPTRRAIELVASEIKKELDEQVPKVVTISRRLAVIAFVLVQCVPFGLVGLAAYKKLKVRT